PRPSPSSGARRSRWLLRPPASWAGCSSGSGWPTSPRTRWACCPSAGVSTPPGCGSPSASFPSTRHARRSTPSRLPCTSPGSSSRAGAHDGSHEEERVAEERSAARQVSSQEDSGTEVSGKEVSGTEVSGKEVSSKEDSSKEDSSKEDSSKEDSDKEDSGGEPAGHEGSPPPHRRASGRIRRGRCPSRGERAPHRLPAAARHDRVCHRLAH